MSAPQKEGSPMKGLEGILEQIQQDSQNQAEEILAAVIRGHFGEVPKLAEGAPLERE